MASIGPDEGSSRVTKSGLRNILMQLRKVSNHPYLFLSEWSYDAQLIRCSGKLALLDRLLLKMRRGGELSCILSMVCRVCCSIAGSSQVAHRPPQNRFCLLFVFVFERCVWQT